MKEKYKYLLKNTGLLFISNFTSKILVFFLVPLYTSILTTAEYGTYDLLYSIIQMMVPVLSLNIIDAVMRFTIGEDFDSQRLTFSIGLKYTLFSIVLFIAIVMIGKQIKIFESYTQFCLEVILLFSAYGFYNFITQFARGIDDVSGIAISGVISTVVMLSFNILFLMVFDWKIHGFFFAMGFSMIVPTAYLIMRDKIWNYITYKDILAGSLPKEKEMLNYALPLIFITLSWHINNVSDRYVVTLLCGISANGIYSVSYKLPAILNAVQTVFIQAWQLSAIKEYRSEKSVMFYKVIYQGYQIIMVILCSLLIIGTKVISRILFSNDFYNAWVYVPVLLLSVVFNTMSGAIGGVFSATKQSKKMATSAITGAIVNTFLNFLLVYQLGPMGAAIATVVSSGVIWIMRMKAASKIINLNLNLSLHIFQYILLIIQIVVRIRVGDIFTHILIQIVLISIIVITIIEELKQIRKEGNR